jgi:COMPASS component SWD3
MSVLWRT